MHIFFSGIGGTAIGPLALIARQAGFVVSGSDAHDSQYISYLRKHGVGNIHIGQTAEQIADRHAELPIDWYVYSAAVSIEQPDAPEFVFCRQHNIRMSMRDELLNEIITRKKLQMIAIAGTHGKTTTTAMMVWLMQVLGLPVSYSVGAKLSFGEMGRFDPDSRYFVYEADEYARNFLAFQPALSLITGIDWDHPDIYPTRQIYDEAFITFLAQSKHSIVWQSDTAALQVGPAEPYTILQDDDPAIEALHLPGLVNRRDAWLVIQAGIKLFGRPAAELVQILERFPGVSRRFECLRPGLYTDYAHTPPKIAGALQMAHEAAGDNVTVIYEGLHNTRQHFIKDELRDLFNGVRQLVIVPSYLAREDPNLALWKPEDLKALLNPATQRRTQTAELDNHLQALIQDRLQAGDLVLCLSAGGGGSLDEWLRRQESPAP